MRKTHKLKILLDLGALLLPVYGINDKFDQSPLICFDIVNKNVALAFVWISL